MDWPHAAHKLEYIWNIVLAVKLKICIHTYVYMTYMYVYVAGSTCMLIIQNKDNCTYVHLLYIRSLNHIDKVFLYRFKLKQKSIHRYFEVYVLLL